MRSQSFVSRKRVLLIANPVAGGFTRRKFDWFFKELRTHGCDITVSETKARGDAERLAADAHLSSFDVIAIAGGDGTINEVINGLPKDAPPIAILPLGTVNVLAREIGMPSSTAEIAATLVSGPSRSISLGEANGRRFAMMASVGLDAIVIDHLDLRLKRYLGKTAYLLEAIRQGITAPLARYRICADHQVLEASGVIVANGRHYAGGFIAAPNACIEKPMLDICRMTRSGRFAPVSYLASMALGHLADRRDFLINEATSLDISGPAGLPVQADGDLLCRLPATFRVLPDAVELIFPA
jgi:YegS/Rv2252/BmrU family lipid kinase